MPLHAVKQYLKINLPVQVEIYEDSDSESNDDDGSNSEDNEGSNAYNELD